MAEAASLKAERACAIIPCVREDYYQLLDTEPTASKQELREAYRRVAKRYHPDLNGDSPAAEERFKLIAEAWRVLGDDEKRAEYDDWLDRHHRYAAMPELNTLPRRRAHVSTHRVQELRRARRHAADAGCPRRARLFLMRPKGSKVSGLAYVLISLCFVLSMLPHLRRHLSPPPPAADHKPAAARGESPLPPAEQKTNLENFLRRLQADAERGNPTAQYRYGYLLYAGTGGIAPDKAAALHWWQLAAAAGYAPAQDTLRMIDEQQQHTPSVTNTSALPTNGADSQ